MILSQSACNKKYTLLKLFYLQESKYDKKISTGDKVLILTNNNSTPSQLLKSHFEAHIGILPSPDPKSTITLSLVVL